MDRDVNEGWVGVGRGERKNLALGTDWSWGQSCLLQGGGTRAHWRSVNGEATTVEWVVELVLCWRLMALRLWLVALRQGVLLRAAGRQLRS